MIFAILTWPSSNHSSTSSLNSRDVTSTKSELSSECLLTLKLNVSYTASFKRALTRILVAFIQISRTLLSYGSSQRYRLYYSVDRRHLPLGRVFIRFQGRW